MSIPNPALGHYKLETEFHDGYVVHTNYEWDYSVRRVKNYVKWKRGKTLGKGAFGEVWLEEEEAGELRAVKCLERHSEILIDAGVTRELLALITLTEHKHLFVELFGWYENQSNIFIAMEYMKGGDLSGYIKDPEQARSGAKVITKQILEGLKVIHEHGICHRDLKPQNILIASLDPIWIKLADFGASKQTKGSMLRTRCGTHGYLAPEMLGLLPRRFRLPSGHGFSFAIDMWSLGCLLHEMLTSQTPFLQVERGQFTDMTGVDFFPQTDMDALFDYCQGDLVLPLESLEASKVSVAGIGLINELLTVNPTERPSAIRTLQHSWLTEGHLEERFNTQCDPIAAGGAVAAAVLPVTEDQCCDTDPASGDIAPAVLSVTEDQCFNNLTRFVEKEKAGLCCFYDEHALRRLALEAKEMVEKLFIRGCNEAVAMDLSVLVLYDIAMLIDDSDSMVYEHKGEHIRTLNKTLVEIMAIYDLASGTGIKSIQFLNATRGWRNTKSKNREALLKNHEYGGLTRIGTMLQKKVLEKFVFRTDMKRPLLIITITDGEAEGERLGLLEDVIENCVAVLSKDGERGSQAVSFEFGLLGNDIGARRTYERLRDSSTVGGHCDFLGCLTLEQLSDPEERYRWVVMPKLLLGAIMQRWHDINDDSEVAI